MEFAAWLQNWLSRHPLKEPQEMDSSRYTAEVMARVKALAPVPARPLASPIFGLGWPRFALAAATAVAGAAFAILTTRQVTPQHQTAQVVELAESTPSDDQWIEETVQLLDQLDEDVPQEAGSEPSDQDLLEELEQLEGKEPSASASSSLS